MRVSDRITLDVSLEAHPRVMVTLEKMPSGTSVTTAYFDAAGSLQRQDCSLIIDPVPAVGAATSFS
jgi:hypothetical protein